MCFSATASFMAAGVLIPSGLYCLKRSNDLDRRYWALAMVPLLFGLQQSLEGGVWLALMAGEPLLAQGFTLGFYSSLIWSGWAGFRIHLI